MPTPRLTYLVCATPRSGSTLLCRTLADTGVAGRPEEYFEALESTGLRRQPREYLADLDDPEVERLLPPLRHGPALPPFAERLAAAQRAGTTPNGVFGAKVMWSYFGPVRDGLDHDRVHHVLVKRRDKLRQAISLWRAIQTQQWSTDERPGREPVYSAAAIEFLRGQLADEEAEWEGWLAGRGALTLTYEDFADRPAAAAAEVLAHLGIEAPQVPARPPLARQSDALTEEWVRRHRAA